MGKLPLLLFIIINTVLLITGIGAVNITLVNETPYIFGDNVTSLRCLTSEPRPPRTVTIQRAVRSFIDLRNYRIRYDTHDTYSMVSVNLPRTEGPKRSGAFYCQTTVNGFTSRAVTIVTLDNIPISSSVQYVRLNTGDTYNISVTVEPGYSTYWRFTRNRHTNIILDGNIGKTSYLLNNVTTSNSGVYEIHQPGKRTQGLTAYTVIIVRGCPADVYGSNCSMKCTECYNGGVCHDITGQCVCPPGYSGPQCETACGANRFGALCEFECESNSSVDTGCIGIVLCVMEPYGCSCAPGFQGTYCNENCLENQYGASCSQRCDCDNDGVCDVYIGCICPHPWSGQTCETEWPLDILNFTSVTYVDQMSVANLNCSAMGYSDHPYSVSLIYENTVVDVRTVSGVSDVYFTVISPGRYWCTIQYNNGRRITRKQAIVTRCELPTMESGPVLLYGTQRSLAIGWAYIKIPQSNPCHNELYIYYNTIYKHVSYYVKRWTEVHNDYLQRNTSRIMNLKPFTNYNVSVRYEVIYEDLITIRDTSSVIMTTDCSEPSNDSGVSNLNIVSYNETCVILTWQDPPPAEVGCDIVEYSIFMTNSTGHTTNRTVSTDDITNSSQNRRRRSIINQSQRLFRNTRRHHSTNRNKRDTDDKFSSSDGDYRLYVLGGLGEGMEYTISIQPSTKYGTAPNTMYDSTIEMPVAVSTDTDTEDGTDVDIGGTPNTGTQSKGLIKPAAVWMAVTIVLILFTFFIILLVFIIARRYSKKKSVLVDSEPHRATAIVLPHCEELSVLKPISSTTDNNTCSTTALLNGVNNSTSDYNQNIGDNDEGVFIDQSSQVNNYSRLTDSPIQTENFEDYVKKMRMKKFGYDHEFQILPANKTGPWLCGERNLCRNRYNGILPYDKSRVVLKTVPDSANDYINANYMDGYEGESTYIACQGPLPNTLYDMWRMVWQEGVCVIIMLTNNTERGKNKCDKYWPDKVRQYGRLTVELKTETTVADYTIRSLVVTKGNERRCIEHYQFTSWPDFGVPPHPTQLLRFINVIMSHSVTSNKKSPTIVHCSAGVGRTGTYITINAMIQQAIHEKRIDIFNFVKRMREKRINMVLTKEQYAFIHESVLEHLLANHTTTTIINYTNEYNNLSKLSPVDGLPNIISDYQLLMRLSPAVCMDLCTTGQKPENLCKNRHNLILPFDTNHPFLRTPGQSGTNSYINASYVDGYSYPGEYIVTQMPLPNTVEDLWRLLYDSRISCIVMLNELDKNDELCCKYWPDKDHTMEFHAINVQLVGESQTAIYISRTFTIQHRYKKQDSFTVKQFQLKTWPKGHTIPPNSRDILDLILAVSSWQHTHTAKQMVVHCMMGVSRSAVFCGVKSAIDKMNHENIVDIWYGAKTLRIGRASMIQNIDEYKLCYDLLLMFITTVYASHVTASSV